MTEEEKAEILAQERAEAESEREAKPAEPASAAPAPDPGPPDVERDTKPSNAGANKSSKGGGGGGKAKPEQGLATQQRSSAPATRSGGGGGGAVTALHGYLHGKVEQLGHWARNRVSPEALVRFALFDYAQSEQLQRCTHESIYLSLIACAQVGLEPGGVRQEAFIVPFGKQASFMIGYRGIITLAKRSGLVTRVVGNIVYEGDQWDYDVGSRPFVTHKPALHDRGQIVAAYAYATLPSGELELEVMPIDDLKKVRASAKRGDRETPAYRDWEDQMYRKAPIRRLGKRLPLSPELALGLTLDGAAQADNQAEYRSALAESGVDVEVLPAGSEEVPQQQAQQRGQAGLRDALSNGGAA